MSPCATFIICLLSLYISTYIHTYIHTCTHTHRVNSKEHQLPLQTQWMKISYAHTHIQTHTHIGSIPKEHRLPLSSRIKVSYTHTHTHVYTYIHTHTHRVNSKKHRLPPQAITTQWSKSRGNQATFGGNCINNIIIMGKLHQ